MLIRNAPLLGPYIGEEPLRPKVAVLQEELKAWTPFLIPSHEDATAQALRPARGGEERSHSFSSLRGAGLR
jgi:hypothetical protein